MPPAAMAFNVATVQGHGWMTTTLSEVKDRADPLLFIGIDAVRHHLTLRMKFFSSSVSAKPLMPVIKARFIVLNSQTDSGPENQFGVTMQSPPAALRRPHKALASSRLASGPTRTR